MLSPATGTNSRKAGNRAPGFPWDSHVVTATHQASVCGLHRGHRLHQAIPAHLIFFVTKMYILTRWLAAHVKFSLLYKT